MKKIIEIIKKKWLRDTFLTILLIAIIFAVYFLINWGVEKLNVSDIDLTKNKIYSLSESSNTKLKDVDKEVTIQLINMSNYNYLIDFANKYTQINKNIKIERIDDITTRPDIMSKYNIESSDNKIIFTDGQAYMPSKELDAIWVVFGDSKISPKGGKVIYVDKNKLIKLSQEHDSMMLTKTKGSVRR